MKEYQLNTVTYGTAAAPFLATRCLKQLAIDCEHSDLKVSQIISNDFYVDDMLTGADTTEELISIRNRVVTVLQSAQFQLRKFMSNHPDVLANVNGNLDLQTLTFSEHENCKTLGVV